MNIIRSKVLNINLFVNFNILKRKKFLLSFKNCAKQVSKNICPKKEKYFVPTTWRRFIMGSIFIILPSRGNLVQEIVSYWQETIIKKNFICIHSKISANVFFEIFIEIGANINLNHHLYGHMQRISNLEYTTFQVFQLVKVFQSILRKEHIWCRKVKQYLIQGRQCLNS